LAPTDCDRGKGEVVEMFADVLVSNNADGETSFETFVCLFPPDEYIWLELFESFRIVSEEVWPSCLLNLHVFK
jgi:hypothetical protein